MKEQIRIELDLIQENKDLLIEHAPEIKAKDWDAVLSKIRKQVSKPVQWTEKGQPMPPMDYIAQRLANAAISRRLGQLHAADIGPHPKHDSVVYIYKTLEFIIDHYMPPLEQHKQYTGLPTPGNLMVWVDQYGMNVFDTKVMRRAADHAIMAWESQNKRQVLKREVRKSDPVENYERVVAWEEKQR